MHLYVSGISTGTTEGHTPVEIQNTDLCSAGYLVPLFEM